MSNSFIAIAVKKIIPVIGLALLAFVVVVLIASMQNSPHTVQSSPRKINQLYVFGDSLSDVGTVFRATGGLYPPNPPYFQGRYSNGPVWVEHLASKLEISVDRTTNFACGGATTGGTNANGVPSLLMQVQNFLKGSSELDADALYLIWAGANDYLNGASSPTIAVENLSRAIELLAAAGAKTLLVGNLPDLGQLPATRNNTSANALDALTKAHNLSLDAALNQLQQKLDLKIPVLDANSLYREAITQPTKFGFTNVVSACLNQSATCRQPDKFLFWDAIHPTTTTHRILGETAFSVLKPALGSNVSAKVLH